MRNYTEVANLAKLQQVVNIMLTNFWHYDHGRAQQPENNACGTTLSYSYSKMMRTSSQCAQIYHQDKL